MKIAAQSTITVTGPPPRDGLKPYRPDTFGVSEIVGADGRDTTISQLAAVIKQVESVPDGRRLISDLEHLDINIGRMPNDQKGVSGYYLNYNRLIRIKPEYGVWILSHEGRHAQQAALGFSTLLEFHQPGTALPWDARSYVLLNRILDADADTRALAITAEAAAKNPDAARVWLLLEDDPHFGPLKKTYEQVSRCSGITQAMGAVFDQWFTVGNPPRPHGYDSEMIKWLNWVLDRDGNTVAAQRLDAAAIMPLGNLTNGRNYLTYAHINLVHGPMADMNEQTNRDLLHLDQRLILRAPVPELHQDLAKWRRKRQPKPRLAIC